MKLRRTSFVALLLSVWTCLSAYEPPPVEPGFVSLFDGKDITRHFDIKGKASSWNIVDGVIVATPGGDRIISKEKYDNYVLRLEWNIPQGGNSGVFIHVPNSDDPLPWETGHEVQITDERPYRDALHNTGSLYSRVKSTAGSITPNVWHNFEITCLGDNVFVKLDGRLICDGDATREAGLKGCSTRGHIGLQDYHYPNQKSVQYRNIRIQPTDANGTAKGFEDITGDEANWQKIKTGHGDGGQWVLADGVWSGEQDPPGSGNGGVLVHKKAIGDFEIILETRPDWGVCSGFFLRSTLEGACYQVMIDYHDGTGNVGGIFGEGTGGFVQRNYVLDADINAKFESEPKGAAPPLRFKPEEWARYWDRHGWNEVRARISGNPPTVESWLNGTPISHFKDDQKRLEDTGHIGIQVHGGKSWPNGAKVRFRKIQVRSLSGN
jgi:hypothetical protein